MGGRVSTPIRVANPDPMTGNSDSNGSVEFPNGLKMLWGKTGNIGPGATQNINHGWTKCFQAFCTQLYSSIGSAIPGPEIDVVDDTKFTIRNLDGTATIQVRYFAIGR